MSDDSRYDGMPREELEQLYAQATRNYAAVRIRQLEGNAEPDSADDPHLANAKAIYRALAKHHTDGAAYWEHGQFQMRA